MKATKLCSIDDCNENAIIKGYCKKHYNQQQRVSFIKTCSVKNCNNKHFSNGFCQKHYRQIYKYGSIFERNKYDPNKIIIENNICRMKLYNINNDEIAETIFDIKYKEEVEKWKWYMTDQGYVACNWVDENNKQKIIKLHQAIIYMSNQIITDDQEIDHKDNNRLNNLEENLRICTHFNNAKNRKNSPHSSKYKGVSWSTKYRKWRATIMINNKQKYLGLFSIEEDAAKSYNTAASHYFGEFAQLNQF